VDEYIAETEGRKGLITEFAVVQYDDDDDDDDDDDNNNNNNVNNMYWCNIASSVRKTDIITFLHPCERLVV